MAENLESTIRENAAGPASVEGDMGSVKQHSLRDQIEADKYLRQQAALAGKRKLPIRLVKITRGGAV